MSRRNRSLQYVYLLPVLATIAFVFAFPIAKNVQISLTNARFLERSLWVGISNYLRALSDKYFWHSLAITVEYTLIYTVFIFAIALTTATILDKLSERSRLNSLFRTFFVMPYAIPDVVAAMVFLWMLDYQFGVVNFFLRALGIVQSPVNWFSNSALALLVIVAIEVWRLYPMHALILFAAMQAIPRELYESADIDGAGSIAKFLKITVPHLMSISMILLVLTVIWCFRRFTMIWILTRGGPARATETTVIQIYSYAFTFNKMAYAAAIGNIMLLLTVALVIPYFVLSRRPRN